MVTSRLLGKINRRKIIKNLGQFISIIMITFLAVCLASGLNSSASTLQAKLNLLLDESNYADGIVYGEISDDDTHVFEILQYEYQQRLQLSAKDNTTSIDLLISDGVATINKPFTDDYNGGVYITHELARRKKYEIGDTISLDIDFTMFSGYLSSYMISILDNSVRDGMINILTQDTITLDFVIDGFMYHPEGIVDTYPISMSFDDVANALNPLIIKNYTDTSSLWPTTSMSNSDIISYLEKNLYGTCNSILFIGDINYINDLWYFDNENYFVFDTKYIPGVFQMQMDIDQAHQLTYVFPVVFILVSILIIITTISQLIFKERLNIATLKSIGITNKQVYSHYIFLTITLCMIGGVLGSLVGPMIIPGVMGIKYDLLYIVPNVSNVYPVVYIIGNILLFVIISTLVSFLILRKSVNTLPAALIKNDSNIKFSESKNKIKSWNLKIALRNIKQQVFRSIMVILGVGGCGALFITGFGIDDTLLNTVDKEMYENYACDATISFNSFNEELYEYITTIDDISLFEQYSISSISLQNVEYNMTSLYLIDDNTQIFNNGNFDGIYISSKIAKNLNLNVGDYAEFTLNNNIYSFKIDYIIETGFSHGLYVQKSKVEDIATTHGWIKTNNQEEIDELLTSSDQIKDVYTNIEFKRDTDDALGPISIIKITLQVFAILLGVVVLYNLALLNFKERTRDIATLKVLGLTNIEIAKSLLYEMMILAILGGILGLLLGYPLMVLLLSINQVDFITYIYNLSVPSYLYTIAFTTFTALIINLILFSGINKVKMVESLKSVE